MDCSIVANDIGGVPEAVIDGETGLLVKPGDIAALTATFSKLISDPALRQRLGAAGRVRARQNSWRDSAQSLFGQAGIQDRYHHFSLHDRIAHTNYRSLR